MDRFEGKAMIVAGADTAIGRAVAAALVRDGAFVEPAAPLASRAWVERALGAYGRIDGLIVVDASGDVAPLCRSCAPHLAQSGGSIVLLAPPATPQMVRDLAVELGPLGVRVNGVSPGLIDPAEVRPDPRAAIPLRRYGHEEEVAQAILFLASDSASYITGAVLAVDGGLGLVSPRNRG
ncbi:MAG TPA: SDR family oxidoreductase [Fimbriimonas sp.]